MTDIDGPKRSISQEMTAVIPRDELPPVSRTSLASLDLDPDHPETQWLASRATDDDTDEEDADEWRTTPTMVPCPAGCNTCSCCHGQGMVSADEAAAWRIQQADAKAPPDDAA